MQPGERRNERNDLHDLEIHLFVSPQFRGVAELDYTADDGGSFAYAEGRETRVVVRAERRRDRLQVSVIPVSRNDGPLRIRWVTYDDTPLDICLHDRVLSPKLSAHHWTFAGSKLSCRIARPMNIG